MTKLNYTNLLRNITNNLRRISIFFCLFVFLIFSKEARAVCGCLPSEICECYMTNNNPPANVCTCASYGGGGDPPPTCRAGTSFTGSFPSCTIAGNPPCCTANPTPRPPTATPAGPTSTPRPPTATPRPPTATPRPPTPTRTPTPTPAQGPWIKLKDSSFISSNNLNNRIPALPTAYDSDDTTEPYYIINQGGVTVASSINMGPNPGVKTSNPEYKADYNLSTGMTPSKFLQYIKSRKAYKLISSLDEIDADGIYSYLGAILDIDSISTKLNQFNTVIIVTGTINVNTNLNGGSLKSLVLLATDTISFSATVTEANGIFVAPTINTGATANLGLKIIGNLIAQTSLNNNRRWADVNKPVVFIKFNPVQYINLLPYLSTVEYGWKQKQ